MATALPIAARPRLLPWTVHLVQSEQAFASLQPEWDRLVAEMGTYSIALSHAWLQVWWETFQAGRQLTVLLVRDANGGLVGAAPFLRRSVMHRGLVPFRRLEFLATGEDEADEIDSDYLDFLYEPGQEGPVLECLFRHLIEQAGPSWDEIVLRAIAEESPTLPALEKLASRLGLRFCETQRQSGVVVPLPATWEAFLARLGHKARYNLRRERRLLEEHGPYDFRFTETQAEFEVLWPRLVELHQRRWSGEGQPGCFASPLFTRFHARIGPELASRGMARLAVLSLNGQTVAARYLFANGRRLMCYQSGFDAASAPGVPLGKVLLGLIIEAAIGEGFECLDFLKGVTPHKLSWSKAVHAQVAVRLSRETWREQVRGGIEWGVSRAKAWRRSFRNAQPSVG